MLVFIEVNFLCVCLGDRYCGVFVMFDVEGDGKVIVWLFCVVFLWWWVKLKFMILMFFFLLSIKLVGFRFLWIMFVLWVVVIFWVIECVIWWILVSGSGLFLSIEESGDFCMYFIMIIEMLLLVLIV